MSVGVKRGWGVQKLTDGGNRVAGRQERERGSVDDPQTMDAEDAGLGVDNGILVARLAHGAGAGGVEDGVEALADDIKDLLVRVDAGAREVFRADEDGRHGFGGEHLSNALISGDGDGNVGRVGEPVGVDDGGICGVGG